MNGREAFLVARDFLVQHRNDRAGAIREFRWPVLETFNWAIDYFDAYAAGNESPALWIVEENGSETKVSFRELSLRSNQIANSLRALGVRRGEGVLIMLDNVLPLWEMMLACIKLGAVLGALHPAALPGGHPGPHRSRGGQTPGGGCGTDGQVRRPGCQPHPHQRGREGGWLA